MNLLLRPMIEPEDFEAMPETDHCELVDGYIKEKEMGAESSSIQVLLSHLLIGHVMAGKLGWMFDSEMGFICFPHRPRLVRKPDVSFVRNGRFPRNRPPRGYARLVPDFAAEVVSPNDTYSDIEDKINDYLTVGVPLVWVVNPACRTVYTYTPDGAVHRLTADQELTGEPVFPGFRVKVADLFPEPLPLEPDSEAPPDLPA
jgi:Uma2 family endonuclease